VSAPDVSVIVLNYNGRPWLAGCLDALGDQGSAPSFEIVVVDNASADDSVAFIARGYPEVKLVENRENLGFAAGNNVGARHARGGLLVFLNNDTVPSSDWLGRLCAPLRDRPELALAASRVVFLDDPEIVDSAGDGYLRAGGAYKRGHGSAAASWNESREVFGACGAAFAIRRAVFEELGGFDDRFFMVHEDVDLSYRARLLGYRCWYAADAVVLHAGSGTLGRSSPRAVFYGQRNLEWTWIKNTPLPMLARSAPAHVVYSVAGLLYYLEAGQFGAALRGKLAAFLGLPQILSARRRTQRQRRVPWRSIHAWMDKGWIGLKRREKSAASRL
jgi:N-acetylglucosaminyl-diphospho-decaprenol L-rhamnosyltransferase